MQIYGSIIFAVSLLISDGNAKNTNITNEAAKSTTIVETKGCTEFHSVVKGEISFLIATKRGLLLSELQSYNPGVNLDVIDVGKKLCINQEGRFPPSNPDGLAKVVTSKSGQTCDEIAKKNNITPKVIRNLNSFSCKKPLEAGVMVYVTRGVNPKCDRFYTIVEADTATKIASSNELTIPKLQLLNPGLPMDPVFQGNRFCVAANGIGTKTSPPGSPAVPPPSTPTPVVCTLTYTVVKGDFAFKIATERGMILAEISALNPNIPDLNVLDIGQKLCLNQAGAIPPSKPDGFATTVKAKKGDTCKALASQNKITDSVFKTLNAGLKCDAPLNGGETVFVTRGFTPNCKKFHTIAKDETANGIAQENKVTLNQLETLNPGLSVTVIFPDQRFCVA